MKPRLLVLDNAADVYAGNENERSMVRQFITMLRGLAIETGAHILLTLHPSLTGLASGSGISGTTAWFNSVRAQLFLKSATTPDGDEPDPDVRVLEAKKNQYGPLASEITVRWKDGVFIIEQGVGGHDRMAAEQRADDVFLKLLARFNRQGQDVSSNKGPTYAPAAFADHPEAKGIGRKALGTAMQRLLDARSIVIEQHGPPSRRRSRLVLP